MRTTIHIPYSSLIKQNIISIDHLILAAVTVAGALLRLPLLFIGIWRDEAAVFFDLQGDSIGQILHNIAIYEATPPGFFLMMMPWLAWFGHSELMMKLPVFIMGIGLIIATYQLGRMVSSPKVGLMAAAITALSQYTVFFSQEARSFTPTALLACLCMGLYCQILRHSGRHKLDWIAFILAMTGLLYFHTPACLFAISLGLITLALGYKNKHLTQKNNELNKTDGSAFPIQKFLIAGVAITALYLPWLRVLVGQILGKVNYMSGEPWGRGMTLIERPMLVFYNLANTFNPGFPSKPYILGLVVAAILIFRHQTIAKRRKISPLLSWNFELTILSASVILLAALEAAMAMGGRYMFFVTPIAYIISAHCLLEFATILENWPGKFLPKRNLKQIVLSCFMLIFFTSSLINTISYIGTSKTSVRPLIEDLQQNIYPGSPSQTVYLTVPDVTGISVGYYQKNYTSPNSELSEAEFHGFPKWENPELHETNEYYKLWQKADIANTLQNIDREHQSGKHYLGLIYSKPVSQWLHPTYQAKINNLIQALHQRYQLIQEKDYITKKDERYYVNEECTFYLFDLDSP